MADTTKNFSFFGFGPLAVLLVDGGLVGTLGVDFVVASDIFSGVLVGGLGFIVVVNGFLGTLGTLFVESFAAAPGRGMSLGMS